jgi:hypothetical protein
VKELLIIPTLKFWIALFHFGKIFHVIFSCSISPNVKYKFITFEFVVNDLVFIKTVLLCFFSSPFIIYSHYSPSFSSYPPVVVSSGIDPTPSLNICRKEV